MIGIPGTNGLFPADPPMLSRADLACGWAGWLEPVLPNAPAESLSHDPAITEAEARVLWVEQSQA